MLITIIRWYMHYIYVQLYNLQQTSDKSLGVCNTHSSVSWYKNMQMCVCVCVCDVLIHHLILAAKFFPSGCTLRCASVG